MEVSLLKKFLNDAGISPKKVLGQNFLINEVILQDIVDSVEVKPKDAFLEIGPGLGFLTERLAQTGHPLLSVEKDQDFQKVLGKLAKVHSNLEVMFADFLHADLRSWFLKNQNYHIVANIPYYITGKLIQMFLRLQPYPKTITILVQKEVAKNLTAKPGKMNLLALSVVLRGSAKILFNVPAFNFYPKPKVDSAVVCITVDNKNRLTEEEEKKLFALARACFAGKRKQIHNTLSNYLHVSKEDAKRLLEKLKLDPQVRPQELSLDDWKKILTAIK